MKPRFKCFFLWTALCLCLLSCGDEGVLLNDLVPSGPSPLIDVGPVPEDIQAMVWGKDVDTLKVELEDALDGVYTAVDGVFAGRMINDPDGIHADLLIHRICLRREQEAYYTKYINAGGVAIMGNGYIDNRFFYAARDIVMSMTRKKPELREHLSPSRENRPGAMQADGWHDVTRRATPSRKFRMILVHAYQGNTAMPELRLANNTISYPVVSIGGLAARYGRVNLSPGHMLTFSKVFIHEFAHAIHTAINLLDTTFDDRLEAAYQSAKKNGSFFGDVGSTHYALTQRWEYWAVSAEEWFDFLARNSFARDQFRETDPLMYELLDEWFDPINMREVIKDYE